MPNSLLNIFNIYKKSIVFKDKDDRSQSDKKSKKEVIQE